MTVTPTVTVPVLVRIELPASLCRLSGAPAQLTLACATPITQRTLLNTLEAHYPALAGTLRDHITQLRRPYLRFFACGEDLSHLAPDDPLPDPVALGNEPFLILGAISGG